MLLLFLAMSAIFYSCAGIGDGALMGNVSVEGDFGFEVTYTCNITVCNAAGETLSEHSLANKDMNDLLKLLRNGIYDKDRERNAIDYPYIELEFYHGDLNGNRVNYSGVYRVYSDNYVLLQNTSGGNEIKGHLDGAYQKIIGYND